jgi:hypothetical protein
MTPHRNLHRPHPYSSSRTPRLRRNLFLTLRPWLRATIKELGLLLLRQSMKARASMRFAPRFAALRDHDDPGSFVQLVPIAAQLPRALFLDVQRRHAERVRSPHVRNHTGLFRHLLDLAASEHKHRIAAAAAAAFEARSPEDHVRADAHSYARGRHPWSVGAELIEKMLRRQYPALDNAARERLLTIGRRAYEEAEAA